MTALPATTLFQNDMIMTISYDQQEILNNILHLHCPKGFDLDVTYNKGMFYRKDRVPQPRFKFDLSKHENIDLQADCRKLPLPDESIKTIIFDPPFCASNHVNSTEYCMIERYTGFDNMKDLYDFYQDSLTELYRVLKKRGVLVFKCQDTNAGRKQYLVHHDVFNMAGELGFKGRDLFILLAKNRFYSFKRQNYARKFHSYFWVFKK